MSNPHSTLFVVDAAPWRSLAFLNGTCRMEAEVRGVNFRRLEPEALRRPIDEMNGDCGRNSLVHGKVIFLYVRLHNLPYFDV